MNWLSADTKFLSPAGLVLLTLAVGILLGRIKFGRITLGLSGILFSAVLVGALRSVLPESIQTILLTSGTEEFTGQMRFISGLGSAVFLSAVGVSSGETLFDKRGTKSKWLSVVMGTVPVILCFFVATVVGFFDREIPRQLLGGLLCGAMTSTPGLTVLCESAAYGSGYATIGYGCTYLLGVSGILIFTQSVGSIKNSEIRAPDIKRDLSAELQSRTTAFSTRTAVTMVFLAVILGGMLGRVTLFSVISPGNSGGILLGGMTIGYLIVKQTGKRFDRHTLLLLRKTGLALFFIGTGIPAGGQLFFCFSWRYLFYGILLTLLPIFGGYAICRLLKIPRYRALSLLCGGLTSTPAIGVLAEQEDGGADLSDFAMAYIGALFTMVIGIRFFGG